MSSKVVDKTLYVMFSLRGRTCLARWYNKSYRISVFINQHWKLVTNYYKKRYHMRAFLAHLFASEFHEIVHIKIDVWGVKGQPCKSDKKCNKLVCFWCWYTFDLADWFIDERGV